MLRTMILAVSILTILAGGAWATVADFDGLSLAPESYWRGGMTPGAHPFVSGPAQFSNNVHYDEIYMWTYWDGWAYSNMTDTTIPYYTNQFSAITGGGQGGSANYGVGYVDTWNDVRPTITLATPSVVDSAWFTNTTYAYYAIRDGAYPGRAFGSDPNTPDDWFLLTITGKDAGGAVTSSKGFYLADYRFADSADDYIINAWTKVDLTSLGTVKTLEFSLSSSDTDVFFDIPIMNNPAYFAMDTLTLSPEPATLGLLAAGLAAIARRRRS
jgi:hypothetical protein